MMSKTWASLLAVLPILLCLGCEADSPDTTGQTSGGLIPPMPDNEILLKEDWAIHSQEGLEVGGEEISSSTFVLADWVPTSVPATVFAALVNNGLYPDPYFGMNLNQVPGSWPPFFDVSLFPLRRSSPFRTAWWYRTEFELPKSAAGKTVWLRFEGINFRANIWLNSRLLADSDQIAGTFREYELNVTESVDLDRTNCLAVKVFAPTTSDLAYNWVDWNPTPPDKNIGIYREVKVLLTGPVALRHPQVISHLDLPGMESADLTVAGDLVNASGQPVTGVLSGHIGGIEIEQTVTLEAGETRRVVFSPGDFPQLHIVRPRVWWPARLGLQNLYRLDLKFEVEGRVSDEQAVTFGIRDIKAPLTEEGYRLFQINGKNILIRGGEWAPDMLLRSSPERQEAEIRYALDMGLNTLRFEGKPETDFFYDLCDRYGLLIMAGWCCCDHWEFWDQWDSEDRPIAAESLKNQVYHLRNHPSALVWLNGSDNPPPPDVEQIYIKVLEDHHWPNPYLSSADDQSTPVTGPSGVKMTGPYAYVPPEYWLADTRYGGAFGFNTETSPGESVPPVESLKKFLPPEHLWPIDGTWDYHAGRGYYMTINPFTRAMNRRYGKATDLEDYVTKAQVLAYDNHRAMFEAFGRNKYHATGLIQWMMNTAWPSTIWHLYDYYLRPAGAYFGAKKALEMLHVQYSYDDRSIVVVNSYQDSFPQMTVTARILNLDMTERFAYQGKLDVPPDSSTRVIVLPKIHDLSKTYIVWLELKSPEGEVLSRNFYWLSTRRVVLAWNLTFTERLTPVLREADMTLLNTLPTVSLKAEILPEMDEEASEMRTTRLTVENPSQALAFFIQLRLTQGPGGDDVLPVYWEDNYVSLLPGEQREIACSYRRADLLGHAPAIEINGWNTAKTVVE